jgi:hypothetical protein
MGVKIKLEYDVEDCNTCPFRRYNSTPNENFFYCGHEDGPKGYGAYIKGSQPRTTEVPDWCPIGVKD